MSDTGTMPQFMASGHWEVARHPPSSSHTLQFTQRKREATGPVALWLWLSLAILVETKDLEVHLLPGPLSSFLCSFLLAFVHSSFAYCFLLALLTLVSWCFCFVSCMMPEIDGERVTVVIPTWSYLIISNDALCRFFSGQAPAASYADMVWHLRPGTVSKIYAVQPKLDHTWSKHLNADPCPITSFPNGFLATTSSSSSISSSCSSPSLVVLHHRLPSPGWR